MVAAAVVSHDDDLPQIGAPVANRFQLGQVLGVGDCNRYPRGLYSIGDIARCHQCRPRHRHEPSPDASQHDFPPLHEAWEHGHHTFARLRTYTGQGVRDLLGALGELSIGDIARPAVVANPEHGPLVGIASPLVKDLIGPVVTLRSGQLEGAVGLVVVADLVLLVHHDVLQGISQR